MNTKIIYPISSQSHIYTGDVFREIYLTRSSSQSYKEQSHCSRFAPTQKNTNKKKRSPFELLFVPYDVLFSNEFLRDLGRLWSLRDIAPNPNNL